MALRNVEEVRAEHKISDVLRSYNVPIRSDRYKPFCHPSKSYSGRIDEARGVCNCYVCNLTFDVFGVVGHFEGLDKFTDQLRFLGGEETEDTPERIAKRKELEKQQRLREQKEKEEKAADELYQKQLKEMKDLRDTLRKEKQKGGEWPTPVFTKAYERLQELDYITGQRVGDLLAGNMTKYPEAQW